MKKKNLGSAPHNGHSDWARYMESASDNKYFRRVLATKPTRQFVAMYLKPGETIGNERHPHTTQEFWVVKGQARVDIEGVGAPIYLGPGQSAMVAAGHLHDVGSEEPSGVHLLTIYHPPQHPPGTIHKTRQDAQKAEHRYNPRGTKFSVGDVVRHKVSFLRSIQWHTDVPSSGTVTEAKEFKGMGPQYVKVLWEGEAEPRGVLSANIELHPHTLSRRTNRVLAPSMAESMLLEAQAMEVQETPTVTGRPRAERLTFKEVEAELGEKQKECHRRVRRLQAIDKALRKLKKTPGNEEKIAALKTERATVAVTRGPRKGKAPKCLYEPSGLAAAIGRGKYGKQWMSRKARVSKAMRRPNPSDPETVSAAERLGYTVGLQLFPRAGATSFQSYMKRAEDHLARELQREGATHRIISMEAEREQRGRRGDLFRAYMRGVRAGVARTGHYNFPEG